MSISSEISRITDNIAAAYTACDGKGATMPQVQNSANLAAAIGTITSGPAPVVESKNVNLIDMDGTLLYSYTKAEALALTALPSSGGTHTGFIFDGWNWSLANIKSYLTNHPDAIIPVAAQYKATDDETRFYITIPTKLNLQLPLYFSVTSGTVTIDWGDGTTETASGSTSHTYSPSSYPASYIIKCTYSSSGILYWGGGNDGLLGTGAPYKNMLTKAVIGCGYLTNYTFEYCKNLQTVIICSGISGSNNCAFRKCSSLQSIAIPDSVTTIGNNMFYGCDSLQSAILPNSVTVIGGSAFSACVSLKSIVIPDAVDTIGTSAINGCNSLQSVIISDSVASIANYAFAGCMSLQSVVVPDSVTTIGNSAFSSCESLQSVVIPDSVASIGSNAFNNCSYLVLVDVSDFDGTVPQLGNSSVFGSTPAAIKFAAKNSAMITTFSADTNWNTYSGSFIVKDW